MKNKKIAILTSGGDAPGMNSAILGAYEACAERGIKLFGALRGYDGLIDNEFVEMTSTLLAPYYNRGGSVIKSARSKRFLNKTYFNRAVKNLKDNNFDALIVIGGDGSLHGAIDLCKAGVKVVCIPATIDNDLNFSYTLGYDSAANIIVGAIDNISTTLTTFGYGAVIKIMGRECADLTNYVASAVHTPFTVKSADFDIEKLSKQIKKQHKASEMPIVVLVLDDILDTVQLSKNLEEKCGFPFRPHILGYVQRGGNPSALDRKYGYEAGKKAVETCENETGVCIGLVKEELVTKPITDCFKVGKNA